MINKIMGNVIPKVAHSAPAGGAKGSRMTKFLQNEGLGKVLEVAADNQNVCQAGFALAICCLMRPVSNYIVTKDKKDATFASAHSISSGLMGFAWPLVFATPLAAGVKYALNNPQKVLRPDLIKKFYPDVKIVEEAGKNGSKIKKVATNVKGEMLRENGTVLSRDLEPLMVMKEAERAPFEKAHPNLYIDEHGVVRSKEVAMTENGVIKKDKDGKQIGAAVQEDLTPITEEMEIGAQKEKNVQTTINMCSDILLAPIRASLTIAMIPTILGFLGLKKAPKDGGKKADKPQQQQLNVVSAANNATVKVAAAPAGGNTASVADASKKGGAR